MEEQNRKKDHEYNVNLALWENFEKDRTKAINVGLAPPPFPTNRFKNNSEIKRKPPKPTVKTYEQPRLLCTCLNSSCIHGTKVGNTSVAKCPIWEPGVVEHAMVLATDPFCCHHEWQDNQCTCPICKCPCNKLYYIAAIPRILHAGVKVSSSIAEPSPAMEATNFVNTCLCNARQGWLDTDNMESHPEMEEKRQDEFYHESVADFATRTGHSLLTPSATQYMQQKFGMTNYATLPDGSRFDTRTIASGNKHAENNCIPGASCSCIASVAPGMVDNLNIDYSNMSDEYFNATKDSTKSFSQSIFSGISTGTIQYGAGDGGGKCGPCQRSTTSTLRGEPICLDGTDDRSRSNDSISTSNYAAASTFGSLTSTSASVIDLSQPELEDSYDVLRKICRQNLQDSVQNHTKWSPKQVKAAAKLSKGST
jgi:hypothetical protein